MSNDDVKLVYSPFTGVFLDGNGTTANESRRWNRWRFDPWTGAPRSLEQRQADPYGRAIVPSVSVAEILRERLRSADSTIADLRKRLDFCHRAVDTQVHKVIKQQKTINDTRQELAEAKRQLGLARAQDQNTFAALEEELKCATNVIANLRDTIQTHVRAQGILAKELNEATRTIADLRVASWRDKNPAISSVWFEESSGFTPEVWNKMLWGVDPAKPGTDETVVTRVGRGQSHGGPAELHNLPKGSAQLQKKIARQAKTLREQEALIEKLKARLRAVPRPEPEPVKQPADTASDAIPLSSVAEMLLKSNELLRDLPWKTPNAWHDWKGGATSPRGPAFARDTRVDVVLRSGTVFRNVLSRELFWSDNFGQGTIAKWRLA